MEKSFFFLPSLTARIPFFGKKGLWGQVVGLYSDLGCLYSGKTKPQAYPCDVCAGKHVRKRKELSTALAVLWPGELGSGDHGLSVMERNCSLPSWNGFTLAGWQMPTLLLWPLLPGATPADSTWTQTSKTPPQRTVQAAGVPMPSETPCPSHSLWMETRKTNPFVQQGWLPSL